MTHSIPTFVHPLDPLSALELQETCDLVRTHANEVYRSKQSPSPRLWFKAASLREPAKAILVPFLDSLHDGQSPQPLPRQADVLVGVKTDGHCQWLEYYLCLGSHGKPGIVERVMPVSADDHVAADGEEMIKAEEALLQHPDFQKVIAELRIPENATVVADGWIYGCDTEEVQPRFVTFMVYLRYSNSLDSNHYSFPLPVIPTLYADDFKLYDIQYTPIFGGESTKTFKDLERPFPWEHFKPSEYAHGIREQEQGIPSRTGLKPYQVVQPEGASFQINGRMMDWQKWTFHIGFNFREGVVINDVRYDGRKVFHRLSVSDMTVPYGDPRGPFARKQAFDLGDCGAGLTANELQLGCDCLGNIHYLDFDSVTTQGVPNRMKGVVCIHEQDEGIGWKHTNFRTGVAAVTRSRVLVVQTVITVANYEYIFAWKFDQAAAVHLETRATGILSTCAIMPGEVSPYGNIVSPGVLATNHQHLFSVRIDPSIDGTENTIVQEDSVAMPFDVRARPANNPYGVGYTVEKTPIRLSGWADAAPEKNRVFKIVNPNKVNPISGRPVGYKLVPAPSQMMLAHPDSIAYKRAEFGSHHIWVTSYRENELYSGGHYTNQSNGNAKGILTWVARQDNVENTDLVLWHTFGLTHNPRVEDFPVMPCETHMISLKPADFFTSSPANDVPASVQSFNKSTPHTANGHANGHAKGAASHLQGDAQVETQAKIDGLGKKCCSKGSTMDVFL